MIEHFRVQNYKALRDVALDLTPIHVLIGPNDSGKTSILEAIAALCRSVDHPIRDAFTGSWEGQELVWRGMTDVPVELTATVHWNENLFEYYLSCVFPQSIREVYVQEEIYVQKEAAPASGRVLLSPFSSEPGRRMTVVDTITSNSREVLDRSGLSVSEEQRWAAWRVYDSLTRPRFFRLVPDSLAQTVPRDRGGRFSMEMTGLGLATCLNDICAQQKRGFYRFEELKDRFRKIFPDVSGIEFQDQIAPKWRVDDRTGQPVAETVKGLGLVFVFEDGRYTVPASQVSDGMLLVLAYLAILYLPKPPRVVLVEEPENGIHPKRLQDVLTILRELVKEQARTQVILTTHSPYVVDLFEPEEVTLCRKESDGSISVRRLSENKTVREQLDVFTLGEIWTAEGDEALIESNPAGQEGDP